LAASCPSLRARPERRKKKDCETYSPIATPPIKLGGFVAHALAFSSIYPYYFLLAAAVNTCLTQTHFRKKCKTYFLPPISRSSFNSQCQSIFPSYCVLQLAGDPIAGRSPANFCRARVMMFSVSSGAVRGVRYRARLGRVMPRMRRL